MNNLPGSRRRNEIKLPEVSSDTYEPNYSPSNRRRGRPKSNGPTVMDKSIGLRIRLRRTLLGFSQERLARLLGITFQQVQKYERGTNRVSASRLHQLSDILNVPISYFYDNSDPLNFNAYQVSGMSEPAAAEYGDASLTRREILELARAYNNIKDPAVRKRIYEMVKAVSGLYSVDEKLSEAAN